MTWGLDAPFEGEVIMESIHALIDRYAAMTEVEYGSAFNAEVKFDPDNIGVALRCEKEEEICLLCLREHKGDIFHLALCGHCVCDNCILKSLPQEMSLRVHFVSKHHLCRTRHICQIMSVYACCVLTVVGSEDSVKL